MFKYIIAFSLISFCSAVPSIVGEYYEVLFYQRSPVSAFRILENDLRVRGLSPSNITEYLSTNAKALRAVDSGKWITYLLGSLTSQGHWFVDCKDHSGQTLIYDNMVPSRTFRKELKAYWPSSIYNFTEEHVWRTNYDFTGCCINSTPLEYFKNVMTLHHTYNIGTILGNYGIVPRHDTYDLAVIIHALVDYLGVQPYLRCRPVANSADQYLLEVQICFKREYKLINCHHSISDPCKLRKPVIYPTWE